MKKTITFFLFCFITMLCTAQSDNDYTGMYSPTKRSGDPHGFLNLFIMPDHTYAFAFFGGVEAGTWKVIEDYFILQPDTMPNEHFYMFAHYNDELTDVSVQFDGFMDTPALYSFDNEEMMHPVFNPYPNCTSYPYKINFKRSEHKSINLSRVQDMDDDLESEYEAIKGPVYTYTFDEKYNDFTLVANEKTEKNRFPMLCIFKNGRLQMEEVSFRKRNSLDEVGGEDLKMLKAISAKINQPVKSWTFGERFDYENETWVDVEYPVIEYTKKEILGNIRIDEQNLFEAECDDR